MTPARLYTFKDVLAMVPCSEGGFRYQTRDTGITLREKKRPWLTMNLLQNYMASLPP